MNISWKTNKRPGGLVLTRAAVAACGFGRGHLILDAGCGTGTTGQYLRQAHGITALGLDEDWARSVSARQPVSGGRSSRVIRSRLPSLPFRSGVFDGIFCECVLSLVRDKQGCLSEFFRTLKPGGQLVLSDLTRSGGRNGSVGSALRGQRPLHGRHHLRGQRPRSCAEGALSRDAMIGIILGQGFHINRWEDHTRLLKELAGQMVFDGTDRLGLATQSPIAAAQGRGCNTCRPRLGYCMVIAGKHD